MHYIITKETLSRFLSGLGLSQTEDLPRYLVLSQNEGSLYRLEPLEKWLSHHGKEGNSQDGKRHAASPRP